MVQKIFPWGEKLFLSFPFIFPCLSISSMVRIILKWTRINEKIHGLEDVMERTLSIIKPDGVTKGLIGEVIKRFENAGFKIVAMKMIHMTKKEAEGFYTVHRGKDFFEPLTDFMSSGPSVAMILEGEKAISRTRKLIGSTDPKQAASGTIRRDFAFNTRYNIVHGSDDPKTAIFEMAYFFSALEVQGNGL